MSIDYLDVYDKAIGKTPSTAAAKRQRSKRTRRLTAETAHGQLAVKRVSRPSTQRRTPLRSPREENVVKKRRSKAQRAATKKMIAANRRRSGKRSKGKRRGKRNPILVTGKNLKTRKVGKRKGGAKKGHAKKKHAKSKKKSTAKGGGSSKRSRAAKKAARTRKANKLKRSLAAKKAARSRKRKGGGKKKGSSKKKSYKKKSSKSRKSGKRSKASYSKAAKKAARTRKRNRRVPRHMKAELPASQMAYESRRGKKKRRSKRNPLPLGLKNPIPLEGGLDFFSGMFAVVIGYLFAGAADRMGSTHALTASSAQGGFVDAPAVGQIYDSEAPATPIWSSGMRIAFNALSIAAPMGLSAFIKSRGPKSFFQLMAMAATARVLGKTAEDGMSLALKTTGFGLRLYAPELAAQAKLAQAKTAALPSAAPGTFAGAPKTQALNGAPVQKTIVQNNAPPPAPAFSPVNQSVAGAPAHGGIDTSNHFVAGPSFNPFASTDS